MNNGGFIRRIYIGEINGVKTRLVLKINGLVRVQKD